MRERLTGIAIASVSGALWALCFGRETSLWLGWVALVPFVAVLAGKRVTARRAALLGVVHGFVFWTLSIPWIPPTIHTFGQIPKPLAWCLLGLLALYLSLFRAAFAVAGRRLLNGGNTLTAVALPAVWVMTEWLYGHGVGSFNFPWNLAAYAWVDVPGALPLSAWVGPWGVSYLVVSVNVGLALAWRARRPLAAVVTVLSALLPLAFAARWSRPEEIPSETIVNPGRPVSIVQPNRGLQVDDPSEIRRQYEQLLTLSRAECVRAEPTLLVWPESAAWPHTWSGSWQVRRDLSELVSRGCSVIFNTPTLDPASPEAYFNSALLVASAPAGEETDTTLRAAAVGRYHKRFLVPYGEHVPLGSVFPFIDKLARFSGRFSRGRDAGLLEWQGEQLGLGICYEVVFPAGMSDQVRKGATLLVNISNDAWYGDTSAPRQLFRAARFRAAENRRTMLRAALTGISGVIGARGEVRRHLGLGERGVLRERLAGSTELTPYTRAPWLVPLISAILALTALIRRRRT